MPFTFVQIEEKKSRTIFLAFLFIILIYFLTAYLLLLIAENNFPGASNFPPVHHVLAVFVVAFVAGGLHWLISTHDLTEKLMEALGACPLDPQDTYHRYFKNIVEEVSVATGGRAITPVVIRSAGMNAFSISDFRKNSTIGITEGLLARLSRSQIEAVVAHEAGHIASGDSLSATVLASLGEIYEEAIRRMRVFMRNTRGRGVAVVWLAFIILWVMGFLSKALRFFLSREREYRADALAVRLTRDPLSLAEALQLISRGWRGNGAEGERIQSLFIVNPRPDELDEAQGLYSDLFSTHPPIRKRIGSLLAMAHLDDKALDEHLKNFQRVSPVAEPKVAAEGGTPAVPVGRGVAAEGVQPAAPWFIFNEGVWSGPFSAEQLQGLAGFTPSTWVKAADSQQIQAAYDVVQLNPIFGIQAGQVVASVCPSCNVSLQHIQYEGAPVLQCSYCRGTFVEDDKVTRILIRQDYVPSEAITRLAQVIAGAKDKLNLEETKDDTAWTLRCPACKAQMRRQFYVYSYPVMVDRCIICNGVWFEKNELELLQYLFEHKEDFLYQSNTTRESS
jgi:heat shock protein HtpX